MGAGGKAGKARRAARVSLWVARASTTVLLWTCVVVLLAAAFGEHLAPSVLGLGGVWSGCLAQTLVIVQRPLLLPADRERVAATATAAAVVLPLPPKHKSVDSCLLPFFWLGTISESGGFPSFIAQEYSGLPLMLSPFHLSPSLQDWLG